MIDATLVITNISELLTISGASKNPKTGRELDDLAVIKEGAVAIQGEKIIWVGKQTDLEKNVDTSKSKVIDANNKVVMPGFIDCHTHLVFSGSREKEWLDKINGKDYLEILKSGGGIMSTVTFTRRASEYELTEKALYHIFNMLSYGTTTIESKSGYGLTLDDEIKILRVLKKVGSNQSVEIISTFLGAHVVPPEFSDEDYVNLIIKKMLPEVSNKKLAEYCDVFCEKGAFTSSQTQKILLAAKKLGLKARLHSNQFNEVGGTELAKKIKPITVDHLDIISKEGIQNIKDSNCIAVLLPGVPFFLGTEKYAPAKEFVKQGIPISIATDFNPGSCYCESIPFMISLACMKMKLSVAQAINAVTINAAHAIERAEIIGSIEKGKQADLIVLDIDTYEQLPYHLSMNPVKKVIKKGQLVK